MTFVPFTRTALTRIKNGATALELGWDVPFYMSVCRQIGIPPNIHRQKTHTLPAIETLQKTADDLQGFIADVEPASGPCCYDRFSHTLTRGGHTVTLPRRQASVFHLIAKGKPEDPANGTSMTNQLGLNEKTGVGGHVVLLRPKLAALNLKIANRVSNNGGYWLADLITGEAIKIGITGAAR